MNNTRRRMLTEYLGECWHEITDKGPYQSTCSKCGMIFGAIHLSNWDPTGFNRTFTTAQDMVDLVRKMVTDGSWLGCYRFLCVKWLNRESVMAYLITDPARTCELIAEWEEAEHEIQE